MEKIGRSRWDGNEFWFNFDHHAGLKRFEDISTLGSTETTVALRTIKYQLENELNFEISDDLFCEIFRKVCNFSPVPAHGGYASLEFIQPLQRILETHGVPGKRVGAIHKTFRVRVNNPRCYMNILLHIPHSSSSFPSESNNSFNDLDDDERLLIDYYTDELYVPQQETEHINSVVFPYCRLYCDVERLVNDPLEKDGLGICYSRFHGNTKPSVWPIRSFNTMKEAFNIYVDYHSLVSKELFAMGENTLLIDCHSFSSKPNLLNSNPPNIDICIGYNDDETCPDNVVIGNIVHHFESLGYKVGMNVPFSNSKTFSVPTKYHSVMIEVNKRIYMNEQTLEKNDGFEQLKHDIQLLYNQLLK